MSKEIYISSTPHETRLAIVENDALTEIYYERENEYTLAGSIYNGKVTRVLPGMQSSFVDIGLERDAFLYITDFMEEAGDSADFDTNGNGDSSRRRDRNGSAPTIEGTVAASSDQAIESGNRNDRNGRGDRGRGRGRRDRGGNRDRQPLPDATTPIDSPDAPEFNRDEFSSPAEFTVENTTASRPDDGELGEGAPGADGNRRWRGRRGRRRGRGPGQRDESPQIAGAPTPDASAGTSLDDDSFDIDGAAAPTGNTAPIASAYPATEATGPIQENTGRNDRGDRGDRNGRGNRDRNDRNRGNRNDRGGRDSRAPRGFAPRTSLYGVEDAPAHNQTPELDAIAEPIVLPGESLSKYRKGGETPAASASKPAEVNVIIPAAPEFTIPAGWDGGATLPGESLSRHRRSENRDDSRSVRRQDTRESYRNNFERPAQFVQETAGPGTTETIEAPPVVLATTDSEAISSADLPQEITTPPAPVEYEPIEASASYRIDPAAPSEFRQSAPVLEVPEAGVSKPKRSTTTTRPTASLQPQTNRSRNSIPSRLTLSTKSSTGRPPLTRPRSS